MNKHITIIGGHGLMGVLFCRLFAAIGCQTYKIGSQDWDKADALLTKSDLVIISVPIHLTNAIIKKTADYLKPECILADFTSIKIDPLLSMLSVHTGPVVGLHPMFGPTITTTHNQVIIHCEGRFPHQYQWLLDTFTQLGFTLKSMSANDHDQAMNFIQGIEHFLTFGLGTFLYHKNQHPQQLLEIASPIYLTKLLLLGRIFDQDPALYADIIMASPSRIKLIREFITWLNTWVAKLEKQDKSEFIAEFSKAAQWMGEFTAYAQKVSDNLLTTDSIPPQKQD